MAKNKEGANIIIVGHGAVGSVLGHLLSQERAVRSVVCVDRNFPKEVGCPGVEVLKLDASRPERLERLLKRLRPNILINASKPEFNRALMSACLKNGVNYVDLASYWDIDPDPKADSPYKVEQMDFDERFRRKGLFGLINAGASPGLTNLAAKECADSLDTVDSIKIRLCEFAGKTGIGFAWSVEWLLDEINWKPLVFRNGKYRIAERFSEQETCAFPAPIGRKAVRLLSQEEVSTIPQYIQTKNVDIKGYDSQEDTAMLLQRLGLVSEEKVRVGATTITPLALTAKLVKRSPLARFDPKANPDAQFGFVVEATGRKAGKQEIVGYSVMFPNQRAIDCLKLGGNFLSYPTALAACRFTISAWESRKPGVYPPEGLDKKARSGIMSGLKRHAKVRRFSQRTR